MKYRVTPKTAHERTRIKQYGEVWKTVPGPRVNNPFSNGRLFLSSKGYGRWWQIDQCEPIIS